LSKTSCVVKRASELGVGGCLKTTTGEKRIKAIRYGGRRRCFDITLLRDDGYLGEPNFILSNGLVSHNCNLQVISDCIAMIKEDTGEVITREQIPIDDYDAIKKEGKKDFTGIFQMENPGMREVIHAVGIESLADIAAVTSLIRPGPRNMGMDMEFAKRKNGESYDAIPVVAEILKDTHAILVFQEQCLSGDTFVLTTDGYRRIDEIVSSNKPYSVLCLNDDGDVVERDVVGRKRTGRKDTVKLTLENGYSITCTPDHRVLTHNRGWVEVQYLDTEDDVVCYGLSV